MNALLCLDSSNTFLSGVDLQLCEVLCCLYKSLGTSQAKMLILCRAQRDMAEQEHGSIE